MFSLFKKFRRTSDALACRVPEGRRVYAVGDIHGRADLLQIMHENIVRDAADSGEERQNLVVYLGDYLDRGPYVRETLDELLGGLPLGFETCYLKGNHEQIFFDFLERPEYLELWIGLGGRATLLSYQVPVPESVISTTRAEAVRRQLLEAIPPTHLEFLENLESYRKVGDYLFVHAGIRAGVALEKQSPQDLFWTRQSVDDTENARDFKIVHGHTICDQVKENGGCIGIDTGAYATGVLTVAVLEEDRVRFLATGKEVGR